MKTILFLLLIFHTINTNAQDIIKKFDKIENKFYLSLEDYFDLTIDNNSETLDFDMNILKVFDSSDTAYYIKLQIKTLNDNWICSSIESKCIIKFDNKTIYLKPINSDWYTGYLEGKNYNIEFPITKSELLNLVNSKKIVVKYHCNGGEMKGVFNEDEIIELSEFIRKYVK